MKKLFGYEQVTVRANIYLKYKLPKRLPTVRGNPIKNKTYSLETKKSTRASQ